MCTTKAGKYSLLKLLTRNYSIVFKPPLPSSSPAQTWQLITVLIQNRYSKVWVSPVPSMYVQVLNSLSIQHLNIQSNDKLLPCHSVIILKESCLSKSFSSQYLVTSETCFFVWGCGSTDFWAPTLKSIKNQVPDFDLDFLSRLFLNKGIISPIYFTSHFI